MSVHYKFKSALEYDTVTFDGLHISVKDLKNAILQQKRIGKSTDFDLQVTNAQTKEVYADENALIPKNASLLIARIPVIPQKNKSWEGYGGDNTPPQAKSDEGGPIAKEVDLSNLDAPEDDKIRAMMSQSTQEYDPSNYMKLRGANQVGPVPPNYRCYKCYQGGHWIKDCTFSMGTTQDPVDIKKSTGIPRSFMVTVDGPQVPGAMMTPNGQFAVPLVDHQAYTQKPVPMPVQAPKMDIPEDLLCSICSDLLTDAVMIPCCGNSFCDECIRGVLLESEDHECPDCHEKDISPDTLIPNRFLRTSVANFKNTTGYVKIPTRKPPRPEVITNIPIDQESTPSVEDPAAKIEVDSDKQTVISEADSTEPIITVNNNSDTLKKKDDDDDVGGGGDRYTQKETVDGPPGVSPRGSPRDSRKYRDTSPRSPRDRPIRNRRKSRSLTRSPSPRRSPRSPRRRRSRSRTKSRSRERRSGTPTIDEPLGSSNSFPPTTFGTSAITTVGPIQGHPSQVPGNFQPPIGTFPTQGPPPNYRFPPPGGAAPYMPPGPYSVPRGMFDAARPPIGGPPPNFQNFPPRGHRDYNRRMLDRAPAGVIDDPLAAFNRLLREKDEQKRRAKQRGFRRSYSRSRSRSRSYSRSPVRRRSRSPRPNRRSRSRSRSFSLSRSRNRDRDYDDDRDFDRNDRRDIRRGRDRRPSRERDRFFDNYDDKRGPPARGQVPWNPPRPDNYFPPGPQAMQPGYQPNRFGQPRDFGPPFMNKDPPFNQPLPQTIHSIQPQRLYQDIAPPGVDDDIGPPGVEEYKPSEKKEVSKKEDKSDKRKESSDRKRRHDKRSRTPEREKRYSPKRKSRSKDRGKESPDKHKKRRRDSSDKDDRKKDREKDSDEEKSKKGKDKKKHKDKKESEKRKKRDKKEKHKKDSKDKKSKEEFRQVIPKHTDEDDDEIDDEAEKKEKKTVNEKKRSEKDKPKKTERQREAPEEENLDDKKENIKLDEKEIENPVNKELEEVKGSENTEISEEPSYKKEITPEPTSLKSELYGDLLSEIDTNVIENYGKLDNDSPFEGRDEGVNLPAPDDETEMTEDGEIKDYEDEEKDVLELHSSDMDLKAELEKSDILAPVPEKSKWEVDDDGAISPKDNSKSDSKSDKNGKVTNEVLKRAENAIFAKAINAIRPIEIKKIGSERAKLYSGEKDAEKVHVIAAPVKTDAPPVRLSVKERLGVKVEDTDKVINLSRRSNTMSPFSRRGESGRNIALGERRVEIDEYNKQLRRSRSRRISRDRQRNKNDSRNLSRNDSRRTDRKREKSKKEERAKSEDDKKSKRKHRSRTRSESDDRKDKHKKKDKKNKKEKSKKKDDDQKTDKEEKEESGTTPATAKRKATIDEANFEPDYDESHSEDDERKDKKKSKKESENSSSSDSDSSSSSEEERKKKKHKKHRKKKRRESSSDSSSEESDSSDSDRDRKKRKHRKTKKKKKKSKHK